MMQYFPNGCQNLFDGWGTASKTAQTAAQLNRMAEKWQVNRILSKTGTSSHMFSYGSFHLLTKQFPRIIQ